MLNSNTKQQSSTDMKQKLLNILSEKNNKVTTKQKPCSSLDYYSLQRKLSQRSHKLPVKMTKFERERWLFEMLTNQDLTQQKVKEQEFKEIYVRTTKLITRYRNKEIKWNSKREALQKEIGLLRLLLQQN
ncbi:unnamed protein product (macronuclear) [Paramecium tetraurelia]|uniref:Uncharacterized protein n=1 Tax=Paramecium tetraurelia TaxID=5888 RepID=A0DCW7_PARTE|nr:uncharacterized protein GSPATT00015743001 [Paramecium tetraurelia]CAK80884.1 unnamed protein product [Paramecium tetraurelia]|eukprot:XP_001448281.1 hypothetical protein (macronuclear) [Paramecium tetraurelia strain d4-2]